MVPPCYLASRRSWFWKFIGAVAIGINLFGLNFTQNEQLPAIICGAIVISLQQFVAQKHSGSIAALELD